MELNPLGKGYLASLGGPLSTVLILMVLVSGVYLLGGLTRNSLSKTPSRNPLPRTLNRIYPLIVASIIAVAVAVFSGLSHSSSQDSTNPSTKSPTSQTSPKSPEVEVPLKSPLKPHNTPSKPISTPSRTLSDSVTSTPSRTLSDSVPLKKDISQPKPLVQAKNPTKTSSESYIKSLVAKVSLWAVLKGIGGVVVLSLVFKKQPSFETLGPDLTSPNLFQTPGPEILSQDSNLVLQNIKSPRLSPEGKLDTESISLSSTSFQRPPDISYPQSFQKSPKIVCPEAETLDIDPIVFNEIATDPLPVDTHTLYDKDSPSSTKLYKILKSSRSFEDLLQPPQQSVFYTPGDILAAEVAVDLDHLALDTLPEDPIPTEKLELDPLDITPEVCVDNTPFLPEDPNLPEDLQPYLLDALPEDTYPPEDLEPGTLETAPEVCVDSIPLPRVLFSMGSSSAEPITSTVGPRRIGSLETSFADSVFYMGLDVLNSFTTLTETGTAFAILRGRV